jgi:hypothetical protein
MNNRPQPRRVMPGGRWWLLVLIIFLGQVAVIFWLSDRTPSDRTPIRPLPPPAQPAPLVEVAGTNWNELMALTDPTLFALPRPHGFAGLAWLPAPPPVHHPFAWNEPAPEADITPDSLVGALFALLQTNGLQAFESSPAALPQLTLPVSEGELELPQASSLRFADGLEDWRLAQPIKLPAWPATDLLTNTVVRVMLDRRGEPISAVLLNLHGSGSRAADDFALDQTMRARFVPPQPSLPRPSANPLSGLSWGTLVFRWHTVPAAETNSLPR